MGVTAIAQHIPDDECFRKGTLPNGMTYYLCHNENPVGCADFYIAHNVGALQEEDNQNGLAHFLEHMAFNGTRHYPDKGLLEFLAKDGVRFGYNVNAYTSRTETVYNISAVPLVRESFIDSVLLILHDWSCDISCEQDALDAERGVISEEWRLRDNQRYRMNCRQMELIYAGGKQPDRTVLGTMEVINGFKREEILDFYHGWYRPDMQAVIIVGDFDVAAMEAKVKAKFSDIPMPENPRVKPDSYMPPAQSGAVYANMTDPAIRYHAFKSIYKQPFPSGETNTEGFYRDKFCRLIITSVLSDRLKKLSQRQDSPLQSAVVVTSSYEPEFYISLVTISPRSKDRVAEAFEMTEREVQRICRHGVSAQELEVAKLQLSQTLHLDRSIEDSSPVNGDLVKVCLENFLRSYACVTPSALAAIQSEIIASISMADIASYPSRMFVESEKIYSTCCNASEENDVAPSAGCIKGIIGRISAEELPSDYLSYPSIDLAVEAEPGRILSRKSISANLSRWTLSNGATVWLRRADRIDSSVHTAMEISYESGFRVAPEGNVAATKYAASVLRKYAGFNGLLRTEYRNYPSLAGISSLLHLGPTSASMSLGARSDRLEDMFALANLQITSPLICTEELLEIDKARTLKDLGKPKKDRDLFGERVKNIYYGNNPWNVKVDTAAVEAVDMDFLRRYFEASFADPSDMQLFICTDESEEQIASLVEKYIASLPTLGTVKYAKAHSLYPAYKGNVKHYESGRLQSAPVSDVSCNFARRMKSDRRTVIALDILDYIMSARYLALIREERGGTYHVDFTTSVYSDPKHPVESVVAFQTRPDMRDILVNDVYAEMERMCKSGPSEEEMSVAVKYLKKRHGELKARRARYVSGMLDELELYVEAGLPYDYDYDAAIDAIDASYIRKIARRIASGDILTAVYSEEAL